LSTLFLTAFIDLLGFGLTIPLLPFYAQRYGATAVEVSLLFSSFSLMGFLFVPVWGELSDRVGRRPVLLISIAATAGSMLLLAFADSYPLLLMSRILQGIMTANISTIQAYIADVTTPQERGRAMGLIGAAFGLGFILGPFVGGVLSAVSFRAPGLAAAALATVNLALAFRNLPESLKSKLEPQLHYREGPKLVAPEPFSASVVARVLQRQLTLAPLREAFRQPAIAMLVVVFFVHSFAFTNMEATFALFVHNRFGFGAKESGYLFGYIGLMVVVAQATIYGRLSRKYADVKIARVGFVLITIAMVGLVLVPSGRWNAAIPPANFQQFLARVGPLWLILPFSSFGNAFINPSISAATSKRGRADRQGGTLGVQQSAGALARVVGPICAGVAFDHFGPAAPMAVAAGGMVLAALLISRVPPPTESNDDLGSKQTDSPLPSE
jgi:MFS family permease